MGGVEFARVNVGLSLHVFIINLLDGTNTIEHTAAAHLMPLHGRDLEAAFLSRNCRC